MNRLGLRFLHPPSATCLHGLGGAGTFAERTFFKLPEAIVDPAKDVELKDIPFVRRIYGEIPLRRKY